MKNKFWQTLGLATLAGMRSMSAPAFLSASLVRHNSPQLGDSFLRFMQQPITAKILAVLAGAEIIGDKLPDTPDRTAPNVLIGRATSGALIGATLYKSQKGSVFSGALIGSLTAIASTYATLPLRKKLIEVLDQPVLAGAIEDAVVIAAGMAITKARKGTKLSKKARKEDKKAKKAFKKNMVPH